jgi:putative Mn2+ efflux pump MntP
MPHDTATLLKIALLVLSLGLDTFTVAVALGIAGIGRRNRLRVGASFALFEGGMPLVGFIAGRFISGALGTVASLVGIVVLFGAGVWMVYESLAGDEDLDLQVDSWRSLALTSLSVSLDELAIGFSMGALGLPIGITVALIAAQAFTLTLLGTALGNRVGEELAERAERVAGLVLCGLAVGLLAERLAGR